MTDKTAIDKAKDAAERAKNQIENCFPVCDPEIESDPFEWAETVTIRVRSIIANLNEICEAIAAIEAEKPVEENARIIAIDISLGALDRAEYWEVIVPKVIQSYAESYHAEQCKACRKDRQPLPEAPRV